MILLIPAQANCKFPPRQEGLLHSWASQIVILSKAKNLGSFLAKLH